MLCARCFVCLSVSWRCVPGRCERVCLRSALCLLSVCLHVGMFVLLPFFCVFLVVVSFFFSSFFGAGWRCCDVGCWCVFTYKCARFFFLLALRRVGFEVSDDGEVWKTVSVLPAPARQSGRSHLEWGASRPGDKKFSL